MNTHAILSASSAHRWLNCPPSARLCEGIQDTTSAYAEEGRLAHAMAELALRKAWVGGIGPRKYAAAIKKFKEDPNFSPEMPGHVDTYTDLVEKTVLAFPEKPYVAVEVKLDFSGVVPEGFGTGDCVIIGNGELHIIDLKYGKGVAVEAENNPQMMLYALGALGAYGSFYPIDRVTMTICQPRLDAAPSWTIPVAELRAWAEKIRPVAQMAHEGKGEIKSGEWCRWCKAKARCTAYSDVSALKDFAPEKKPLISNDELARRILIIRPYVAVLEALEDLAKAECLDGRDVPGFKVVEGRKGRDWTDADEAFKAIIASGVEEAMLYKRAPLTLAAVETLLGKKPFAEIAGPYVKALPGKPTLAEEGDKRPALQPRSAAEDFKEGN